MAVLSLKLAGGTRQRVSHMIAPSLPPVFGILPEVVRRPKPSCHLADHVFFRLDACICDVNVAVTTPPWSVLDPHPVHRHITPAWNLNTMKSSFLYEAIVMYIIGSLQHLGNRTN